MVAASGLPVVDLWSFDFSRSDSSNRLAITFDDGYEDFARNALPELERFGFPAIVFVVPEAVDRRTTFPWYRGAPHPGLLGWDEMQAIEHAAQVRFEPHSMTHPCLPDLPSDRMRWELFASKQAVEDRFERAARIFCYPGGFYGRREVEAVRDVGYAAAVTCEYGLNTHPFPVFELSRTLIDRYDTGWVFRSRLRALVDRPPLGRRSRILA
jgi:peptidoglycan/xylan/chitin deacetylase (PgdA/CDA1 family)